MLWPTDILSIESWILVGTLLGLSRYYLNRKWSVLKKLNLPHEPPSLSKMGNLIDVLKKRPFTFALENKKKFGPLYGLYFGTTPTIAIHDPEILQRIYTKEFSNFPNREVRQLKISGKELNSSLLNVRGKDWKRIRSTMSPSFSSSKLRHMAELMEWCSENFLELLRKRHEQGGAIFEVREAFTNLTLDMVLSAAFSTKVDTQKDGEKEPEITKMAKQLFRFSLFSPFLFLIIMFPPFAKVAEKMNWSSFKSAPRKYFSSLTDMIMRKAIDGPHSQEKVDFMQLLLENKITEEDVKRGAEKGVTKDEIISNSIVMIIAGYENTTNAMTFLSFNFARHPEIQRKAQSEIDEKIKEQGRLDYDTLNSLKYLDMCLQESMRLYTPVLGNSRASKEEIVINGFTIPANTSIFIPTYALAHDPVYWDEPEEFRPERMRDMSQIDQMMFQPFGAGPRNCIGMRFALLEVKMAVAKLLHRFDIEPTENTPKAPLELIVATGIRPKEKLELRAVPRSRCSQR